MKNKSANVSTGSKVTMEVDDITNSIYFRTSFSAMMILLFIISLCGGVFVSYVIFKNKMVKKKVWLYLLILTLFDTGACFFEIPIMLAACVDENVLQNRVVCNLSGAILSFFSLLAIYCLAAISIHRYWTISRPFESLGSSSRKDVAVFLVVAFTLSCFLSCSPIVGFSRYTYWRGRKWCVLQSHNPKHDFIYAASVAVLGYVLPICTIIFSSVRIVFLVRKQREIRVKSRRASKACIHAEHLAMIKTISLLIGAFFLLWTPTVVYMVAGMNRVAMPLWYSHVVYFTLFMQGSVNTAIYCFRHEVFQRELDIIVCRNAEKYLDRRISSTSSASVRMRSVTSSSAASVGEFDNDGVKSPSCTENSK